MFCFDGQIRVNQHGQLPKVPQDSPKIMNLGYLYVMGQSHFRSFRWLSVKIVIPIKQEFYQQECPILQGFQPLNAKNRP